MGDISFHHGTRVQESNELPVLMRTVQSAVVHLFGTAPDADVATFPLNANILIKGTSDYAKIDKLGEAGTLKDAFDGVVDQIGTYIYITRIEEGATLAETLSNLVGDAAAFTGVHALKKVESEYGRKLKSRIVAIPGFTASLATDGVSAVNVTAPGASYSANPSVTVTGGGGQGAVLKALVSQAGAITGFAILKPGWGYTSVPTINVTDATGTGVTTTASIGTVGNPVVHELEGILEENRAIAFIDGPNTTDQAAVAYAGKYGSDRIYIVDPKGQVWDKELDAYVPQPLSARFAGVQAWVDRKYGFASSVSNKPIKGIDGIVRPISYGNQTNYLNENAVNTVINRGDGWLTYGNRTTSGVSMYQFLSVRRTADFINEALEDGYFEFVDKNPTLANLKFMEESGRQLLKKMENEKYILGGDVSIKAEDNTRTDAAQGRWTLAVKFQPYSPMEDIRMKQKFDIAYYDLLIDSISNTISSGPISLGVAA